MQWKKIPRKWSSSVKSCWKVTKNSQEMFLELYSVRFLSSDLPFTKLEGSNFGTNTYDKIAVTEKVHIEGKV